MSDEDIPGERASQGVPAVRLPNRRPDRMWGGPGAGADCAICGKPAKSDAVEFEIEFVRDGTDSGLDKYHVHIHCFAKWERTLELADRREMRHGHEAAAA
ncbi:MAG: hypothetical protein ACRELZ_19035 [Candidatus Rokuibacteriota bacterium]